MNEQEKKGTELQPSDDHGKKKDRDRTGDKGSDPGKSAHSIELLVPRLIASLFCLLTFAISIRAILTAHYYARSGQLGGIDILLDGLPAIVMGFCTLFWGLIPLALWFRAKRTRVMWAVACFVAAATAFLVSVFLQHG